MHALRVGCGSSHSLSVHVVIVIAIVIIILIVFIRRRNKLLFLGRGWLYACMLPTYLDYVRKVYQRRAVGVVTFHHSLQEVYVVVFGLAPENLVHQRLRFHVKKKEINTRSVLRTNVLPSSSSSSFVIFFSSHLACESVSGAALLDDRLEKPYHLLHETGHENHPIHTLRSAN